ncbi:MAG: sigma-54 dependent transcriptional regulator, acetoin dehydrogenase operon transcriptional, partial [Solirubrobacteraceae bacterium]|nr:sigma-54 dependent transcriptional regulator, acetoin dehydrogenase operon transcriptional [Solirubrobacteraceae bacterium]
MDHRNRFSSPAAVVAARRSQWDAFQAQGTIVGGVRPEIAASWRRCDAQELTSELPAVPLDEGALQGFDHAGQARHQFLVAARRLADALAEELCDAAAAVIVCDDFGVVLYRAGDRDILRRAGAVNLVPGGVWSEQEAGTNGVGLALELGAPAHVHAAEHYVGAFHGFSCTAAPVRHPITREVLGIFGLTTDTSISGSFASPLVTRAALDVERLLEEQLFGRERELLEHYLRGRAGQQAPFLTVDRAGHTIIQNARMLQSASGQDVQLLLSIARQALSAETDAAEPVELSRGRSRAAVRLVRAGSELLGALVSVEPAARSKSGSSSANPAQWAPLIGRSLAMQRLLRDATRVAQRRVAVTIHGEPGSGKLMLAQLM